MTDISYRPFRVELVVTTVHEYAVDARSPEEAESIAEQYFADGEEGTITSSNIEAWDSEPGEDDEQG